MADTAVDRMKTSAEPMPVILVGGGAILVSRDLHSGFDVLRPPHSSVANAIGAAVAQVGGEVDRVFAVEGTTRDAVLGIAKREASDRAVAAGADSRFGRRSSTSRTCRSPICRATPRAFASRRWAICLCNSSRAGEQHAEDHATGLCSISRSARRFSARAAAAIPISAG